MIKITFTDYWIIDVQRTQSSLGKFYYKIQIVINKYFFCSALMCSTYTGHEINRSTYICNFFFLKSASIVLKIILQHDNENN